MSVFSTAVNDVWLDFVAKIDRPITEILLGGEHPSGVYAEVLYPEIMFDLRNAIQMQAFESVRAGA